MVKIRLKAFRLLVGDVPKFAVGVMCGEKWYRLSSWKTYGLFRKNRKHWWFNIGPILFWDGS